MLNHSFMKNNAQKVSFKTFRANNQGALDRLMSNYCHNLGDGYTVLNQSTSAFYIPLNEVTQDVPQDIKDKFKAKETQNYFNVNHAEQPIQYIGTIMYQQD